mmetsp:Transcript_37727/g.33759  ORF Transcript_37727/g.33759 Transcript_37727/m.33759 type:complete len:111 (-) Transcript_37727:171-503(-)
MLYAGLSIHTDLREEMIKNKSIDEFIKTVQELKKRREGTPLNEKLGWYLRYMPQEDKELYNDFQIQAYKQKHGEEAFALLKKSNNKKEEEEKLNKPDVLDSGNFMEGIFD